MVKEPAVERIAAVLYRIDYPGRDWGRDKLSDAARDRYRYIARELIKANVALEKSSG